MTTSCTLFLFLFITLIGTWKDLPRVRLAGQSGAHDWNRTSVSALRVPNNSIILHRRKWSLVRESNPGPCITSAACYHYHQRGVRFWISHLFLWWGVPPSQDVYQCLFDDLLHLPNGIEPFFSLNRERAIRYTNFDMTFIRKKWWADRDSNPE